MHEQGVERLAVDGEHVDRPRRARGRIARMVADERHLTEAVARPELGDERPRLSRTLAHDLNRAVHHDVEAIALVPLAEDDLIPLVVLAGDAAAAIGLELDDVGGQEQIQEPVGGHADHRAARARADGGRAPAFS